MSDCNMLELIRKEFTLKETDIRTYSPLTLAYIGDAVYEVIVRTVIVEQANRPVNRLHKMVTEYVKAPAQAQMILELKEFLTPQETEVYKWGKNAKPYTTAKNASRADYHKATGFEALMGYLYLTGRQDRMVELVRQGMECIRDKK